MRIEDGSKGSGNIWPGSLYILKIKTRELPDILAVNSQRARGVQDGCKVWAWVTERIALAFTEIQKLVDGRDCGIKLGCWPYCTDMNAEAWYRNLVSDMLYQTYKTVFQV